MKSEKSLEKKWKAGVEKKGGLCIKIFSAFFTGLPDRLNLLPAGKMCFAEIKSTGKDLSPRQRVVKILLEKLGFTVYVIDDEQSLNDALNAI